MPLSICALIFLALLLLSPEAALQGSKYGATLWISELLPTLFPFFVAIKAFMQCLPKVARKRFALLLGILCGYPTGATLVVGQLGAESPGAGQPSAGHASTCGTSVRRPNTGGKRSGVKRLTPALAYFYLGFVNNPSPMFVISYCGMHVLHMTFKESLDLFVLVVGAGFIGSLVCYCLAKGARNWRRATEGASDAGREATKEASGAKREVLAPGVWHRDSTDRYLTMSLALDKMLIDSFVLIAKIGGYVILFSILGAWLGRLISTDSIYGIATLGTLEITSGISYLHVSTLPFTTKKVLTATLLAFGGLSATAQTNSVLAPSGLSIIPYVIIKMFNACLAGGMMYICQLR